MPTSLGQSRFHLAKLNSMQCIYLLLRSFEVLASVKDWTFLNTTTTRIWFWYEYTIWKIPFKLSRDDKSRKRFCLFKSKMKSEIAEIRLSIPYLFSQQYLQNKLLPFSKGKKNFGPTENFQLDAIKKHF